MQAKQTDFFLGGMCPTGYAGYYSQILQNKNDTVVLLKAGPGCGKSTLLKKLAAELQRRGYAIEAVHCAADPYSLDGIICRELHFSIVDATAPHAIEPSYPVAFEDVITLYNALQRTKLQEHRTEIMALFNRYKALQERTMRYITAAGSLLQDTQRVALCCTDTHKAKQTAVSLSRKYLPQLTTPAQENARLLSANTLDGPVVYSDTIYTLADTVVAIDDPYGAASKAVLQQLRDEALQKGHRFYSCYCSMSPHDKLEHLIFPDLRLAFTTQNPYHKFSAVRTIHYTRFSNNEMLNQRKKRLKFNQKAAQELLLQASAMQREAKQCHDELERFYSQNFNFEVLEIAYRQILSYLKLS